jgi:TorA maturation chaperone TorD
MWYDAPDRALLDAIAGSGDLFGDGGCGPLVEAWQALAGAAATADPVAVKAEFDSTFVGVGKAAITLYCSFYLSEAGRERVVVALRDELRDLGLARTGHSHEPEDHLAALCEVMRHLVRGGSEQYALEYQKAFFLRYIRDAYTQLTDAILSAPETQFYKHLARLTRAFFDVESESFQMV